MDRLFRSPASVGPLALGSSGFGSTNRHSQIIEEDEFISDIQGSPDFTTTKFPINPGQATTFPWGHAIASLYERYEYQFIEFYYRREVSEFSNSGQSGKVILSCDYDASDPLPTNKQMVLDTEPHSDGMPCMEQIVLRLDCKQLRSADGKFVRPGVQPAGTDIKTYDGGNFYISTVGTPDTNVIGELHVRYRVKVFIPVLEGVSGSGGLGSSIEISSALAGETGGVTASYITMFPNSMAPNVINNSLGATLVPTGLIVLPSYSAVYRISKSIVSAPVGADDTTNSSLQLATTVVAGGNMGVAAEAAFSILGVKNAFGGISVQNGDLEFIWPTAIYGFNVALRIATFYAAGDGAEHRNWGWLKIEQITPTP